MPSNWRHPLSHIDVYVLKSFLWSEDGYTKKHAEAHTNISIPEKLFDGLNKEGYVRRAQIGDGHVTLTPHAADGDQPELNTPSVSDQGKALGLVAPIPLTGDAPRYTVSSSDAPAAMPVEGAAAPVTTPAGGIAAPETISAVGEKPVGEATVPAPQPAEKTAALTADEEAALTDGSWRNLRFFAMRSIAAKLSDKPINNGPEAIAAIEAELKRRAAL